MKILYCQRQRCKHVELQQFLARFRVARVCQRQLGLLVLFGSIYHQCIFLQMATCCICSFAVINNAVNMKVVLFNLSYSVHECPRVGSSCGKAILEQEAKLSLG